MKKARVEILKAKLSDLKYIRDLAITWKDDAVEAEDADTKLFLRDLADSVNDAILLIDELISRRE